jgi:DNA polymerase II small subunit
MRKMNTELLKFFFEKGLLVDKEVLDLFQDVNDSESVKFIIEKIKNTTNQNVITKTTLDQNKETVNRVFLELPQESQKSLETFKIKFGLSIEISKEISLKSVGKTSTDKQTNTQHLNFRESIVNVKERPKENVEKIEVKNFVAHFKNRFISLRNVLQEHSELNNLISINKISEGAQGISLIGMIRTKSITKNKNIILEIEDLTGKIKVLINQNKPDLYKQAEEITLDAVLGFKGSGNKEIFFVNDLVFPESMLPERKRSNVDEYALFIGDLHYGSKKFLKESFERFIEYLSGKVPGTEKEVSKIKYLFLSGDIITGIGNYPNQEPDLEILDLEEQFLGLAKLLGRIRKDIKIIISPGNHDCVRLMEPQPLLDEKYAWPLYDLKNVILTENPGKINIGNNENFQGFNILTYHGFSYPYYAGNIAPLVLKNAMNVPEDIMKFLLKNRHLAPTHGSNQYFPLEKDPLFIEEVPDVLVSSHTHKCATSYYNNVLIISTSCWEEMTPYQEKFGNEPDHCKVPMLNLKTRAIKILDFE